MRPTPLACAAAALIFAGPAGTTAAQPARSHPAEELQCLYDAAPQTVRHAMGEAIWSDYRLIVEYAAEALHPLARACADEHHWTTGELRVVASYTLATLALRYARAQMEAIGLTTANWDAAYDALPRRERMSNRHALEVRAASLVTADQNARDPDAIRHASVYLRARRDVEYAEWIWMGRPAL